MTTAIHPLEIFDRTFDRMAEVSVAITVPYEHEDLWERVTTNNGFHAHQTADGDAGITYYYHPNQDRLSTLFWYTLMPEFSGMKLALPKTERGWQIERDMKHDLMASLKRAGVFATTPPKGVLE